MGLFDRSAVPREPPAAGYDDTSYDFVDVRMRDGAVQRMSKKEFEAQALTERIRVLVDGGAVFFRGDVVVPPAQALRSSR